MSHARRTTLALLFSSIDIGFCSITFADALISLEYIYIHIIVIYLSRDRSGY